MRRTIETVPRVGARCAFAISSLSAHSSFENLPHATESAANSVMRGSLFVALFVATSVMCSVHSTSTQSTNYRHTKEKKTVVRVLRADEPEEDVDEEERGALPGSIAKLLSGSDDLAQKAAKAAQKAAGNAGDGAEAAIRAAGKAGDGAEATAKAAGKAGDGAEAAAAAVDDKIATIMKKYEGIEAAVKDMKPKEIETFKKGLSDQALDEFNIFVKQIRKGKFDETKSLGANLGLVDTDTAMKKLSEFMSVKANKKASKGMTPGEILKEAGVIAKDADTQVVNHLAALVQSLKKTDKTKKQRLFLFLKYLGVTVLGGLFGYAYFKTNAKRSAHTSASEA
ncbi:hypothetical protein PsorP6_014941 [Peronosclerospora sorghi]|uniref:Uncharacterized protein n=1 Tax=Peronosclerospora sorghi TaxID=230839 RepID=A0ACC0VRH5_9STRA|nr:hypothetical protein PsorP6_014941 [Peronosclerospora sorghi]